MVVRSHAELVAGIVAEHRPTARLVVAFGPRAPGEVSSIPTPRIVTVQPWRPAADRLQAAGIETLPDAPDDLVGADVAIVRLGRQRQRNLSIIAEAINLCADDGLLIVAGDNDVGPTSYARRLRSSRSRSRGHARAIWVAARDAVAGDELAAWREAGRLRVRPGTDWASAPGLFAWDRIDEGSALLAAALQAAALSRPIAGAVADLGAGWGFLGRQILSAGDEHVTRLDLYEADWHALAAARTNLADRTTLPIGFHWHDVALGLPRGGYDAIVTNPPFHDSHTADTSIGIAFIESARAALRPGGRLWLVANRTLPYEAALRAGFAHVVITDAGARYKIVEAVR
ncbi:MAG: class I SAM-dependent methyltransferase [Alphaproteobacteria bacterium]|nr:class I SAM-dependent methyltransferase [Alphaproteobacteria bacterium]